MFIAASAGNRYRPARLHGRMNQAGVMQTTVNLPDSLYRKSEELAASRGATVEQFIVEAVKNEVQGKLGSGTSGTWGDRQVELPVIRSKRPGTLDLSHFDFDDLLA
jgi:hypothetical protein